MAITSIPGPVRRAEAAQGSVAAGLRAVRNACHVSGGERHLQHVAEEGLATGMAPLAPAGAVALATVVVHGHSGPDGRAGVACVAVHRRTSEKLGGFRNVIGRFGSRKGPRVIVGAHYDSCGDTPGADDNASGVASLIELAYLLQKAPPETEVELVTYALEEPPIFNTDQMGSVIHAKSVAGQKIKGVIVLEMVGYFRDEWGSQSFPSALLQVWYPSKGNFVGVVGPSDQGAWIKHVKVGMKGATDLPVYSIRAPAALPGIDLSDHASYWPHGIPAVMITDTSFYRNDAYHAPEDTADRLDYTRMAKVVIAVSAALRTL